MTSTNCDELINDAVLILIEAKAMGRCSVTVLTACFVLIHNRF